MKVSKSFLNDYVKVEDIKTSRLADSMLSVGNEYESITKISSATGCVVGYVLSCIPHPESDHLHICQVDIGTQTVQIICGAPNVRENIKVIVATIGAVLPGGFVIKKARLAGFDSFGMICSIAELGLESKYLKEEDKAGIHILSDDAKVGSDAIHYLGYDDETIDFELTSNRGDLLSYLGMAYEVGAIYDLPVEEPVISYKEEKENINDLYTLSVETEKCPIYLGKYVSNVTIKESPNFIKTRLMASGIRPINNVVDISNYVMLEYGQPLHFFDADRLGNKVIVRMAKNGENITTLDGEKRVLNDKNIVIANEKEAVALAGVMGGLSTEVEKDTQNIFIESAIFDAFSIRSTANSILRSEASNRYEKGIDANRTKKAIERACDLLVKYADGKVYSGTLTHDKTDKKEKEIDVTLDKINQVLGMKIEKEEVLSIFKRLNFNCTYQNNHFHVFVPTRRLDVTIKEDLIEEIGRMYGYKNLESSLPYGEYKRGTYSESYLLRKETSKLLQQFGFNEVITYSLIGEEESNLFINQEYEKILLDNPMSEDRKILRNSLIPSLLNVYEYNKLRGNSNLLLYENGVKFRKEKDYIEEKVVSGLACGTYFVNHYQMKELHVDFYLLKGMLEHLFNVLGFKNRYQFVASTLKDMHPGRCASILIDKDEVGFLGQVSPSICKKEVYVFEISLDKILEKNVKMLKFKEISKFPSVNKDMAFKVKKDVEAGSIIKTIESSGGRILTSVDVFDVYTGEKVNEDEKSIAFNLTFTDFNKTLTDEEVMTVFHKIIKDVEKKHNAQLRDK